MRTEDLIIRFKDNIAGFVVDIRQHGGLISGRPPNSWPMIDTQKGHRKIPDSPQTLFRKVRLFFVPLGIFQLSLIQEYKFPYLVSDFSRKAMRRNGMT